MRLRKTRKRKKKKNLNKLIKIIKKKLSSPLKATSRIKIALSPMLQLRVS